MHYPGLSSSESLERSCDSATGAEVESLVSCPSALSGDPRAGMAEEDKM